MLKVGLIWSSQHKLADKPPSKCDFQEAIKVFLDFFIFSNIGGTMINDFNYTTVFLWSNKKFRSIFQALSSPCLIKGHLEANEGFEKVEQIEENEGFEKVEQDF